MEVREKLEENNNFHLTFKSILITDENLLNLAHDKIENSYILDNSKDYYEQLLNCYTSKIKYILYNGEFPLLMPLFVVLTNGNIDLIKPFVNTYYMCKDNRIENKIITKCRDKESLFMRVKTTDEMIQIILNNK